MVAQAGRAGYDARAMTLTRSTNRALPVLDLVAPPVAPAKPPGVDDAFRRLIGWGGPGYVPREGLGPIAAIEAITEAGGLPVLAHFSEAPSQIPLLRELVAMGLAGLEVYYISYLPETVTMVGEVARHLGLVATGGSDYHGDLMTYAEAHATLNVPPTVADALRLALGD